MTASLGASLGLLGNHRVRDFERRLVKNYSNLSPHLSHTQDALTSFIPTLPLASTTGGVEFCLYGPRRLVMCSQRIKYKKKLKIWFGPRQARTVNLPVYLR
jgi:hypothetical protein